MLIMNGSRRRTAGGIYFWLVKNDEHIPQEKIREIFYYDQKETTEQRRKNSANVRRQKTQELMKSIESMISSIMTFNRTNIRSFS